MPVSFWSITALSESSQLKPVQVAVEPNSAGTARSFGLIASMATLIHVNFGPTLLSNHPQHLILYINLGGITTPDTIRVSTGTFGYYHRTDRAMDEKDRMFRDITPKKPIAHCEHHMNAHSNEPGSIVEANADNCH
jgi:hypothetical protein